MLRLGLCWIRARYIGLIARAARLIGPAGSSGGWRSSAIYRCTADGRARREAALCVVGVRRFRAAECDMLRALEERVVSLIARLLWDGTRGERCWLRAKSASQLQ